MSEREVTPNLDVLWRDDATEDDVLDALQHLVNTGDAWRLEGTVGRAADAALESRLIALGHEGHRDYYGNYVPSRFEVEPGSKGAAEYARLEVPEEAEPR
jgi:hypothetical protein